MSVINTNVKALYTQSAMRTTDRASAIAMQQLSTGKRINSAKDDAAGLAIATRMTQQISSLNQAMRNAGDAITLIQTAEGATNEITNMLQRMRELSIQAINDTNATEQRGYLDLEFQQLKQEIVRIADTTEWNGFPVLNGTAGQPVGERPVYKVTSAGSYKDVLAYSASSMTASGSTTASVSTGSFSKSGAVSLVVTPGATVAVTQQGADADGSTAAIKESALITFNDLVAGQTVVLDGATFTATAAVNGAQVATAFSGGDVVNGTFSPSVFTNYVVGALSGATLVVEASTAGDITDLTNSGTKSAAATMLLTDGTSTSFSGLVGTNKITFTDTPLTNGAGSLVLATTNVVNGTTIDFTVGRIPAMESNDILINGIAIGMSLATDDTFSPLDSAAGSAIARAAAINRATSLTGVAAIVNRNVMTGSAMGTNLSAASGSVTINGFTSAPINTLTNNTRESRAAVVNAINAISSQTGVVAIDSNSDNQGIRLEAANGRNIELSFNSPNNTADEFAARTGLKEGLQVSTYSLETTVNGPLKVTTAADGDWSRTGLRPGDYTANQAVVNTGVRPLVTDSDNIELLGAGDLVINGVAIRAASETDDPYSNTTSLTSSAAASAIAIAAAINSSSAETGVTAKANAVSTSGSLVTTAAEGLKSLYINGAEVKVNLLAVDSDAERLAKVIYAVNHSFGGHGATATESGTGGITLTTADGRNLSVWHDTSVSASEFGLGISGGSASATGVTAIDPASAASTTAATLYGSISMTADAAPTQPPAGAAPVAGAPNAYVSRTFTVEAGTNGFDEDEGDFKTLGFQAGTFGGDVDDATSKMTPPRTTRMSFHVGASANQTITIDLADFGKGGPITGAITGDSGKTPADVQIGTSEGAKAVLSMLDAAMDKVNGARATMGAVMNRLQHVIDNLSNVVVNTEASRSQIQDADYAAASSELSRTQIMKQAATAVLAQANTDQQTVLKLLQ
jgi:flagellin